MRKIQLILLCLITLICVIVKFNNSDNTSYSQGENQSLNAPNSDNATTNQVDNTANNANKEAAQCCPEPTVESMKYNATSFNLGKPYNFLISLSENTQTTTDRDYIVKVYAGSDEIGAGPVSIKQGSNTGNGSINVKFNKESSFRTNVKIFDKNTNTKVLDKNGTTTRRASNRITSNTQLFGLDHFGTKSAATYKQFKANGVSFIARYYSANDGKCISRSEAQDITNAGLQVVTVYQDSANSPSDFTRAKGVEDCNSAISHAKEIGQPTSTPIYFAVDIDARGSSLSYVVNYFQGVNEAMNAYKQKAGGAWQVGVYGSYDVVAQIHGSSRLATYVWQTASWSRNRVYNHNNIYQKNVNSSFMKIEVDKNYSSSVTENDVGGFYVN